MFCTNCGYQMPDDANFCQKCGRPQNQSAGTVSVRTDAEPQWERMEIELREGGTAKRSIITQLFMGGGTIQRVEVIGRITSPQGQSILPVGEFHRDGAIPTEDLFGPQRQKMDKFLEEVCATFRADGWEQLERGRSWYSFRFQRKIIPVDRSGTFGQVRADGLYRAKDEHNSSASHWLRFYEDGTVLYVGASGSPQQVAAHLNKRAREASLGQYTTQESHIKFSVTVPGTRGSVDFIGQIYTDRLELDVSSNITGYKAHLTYHFVDIPLK